MAINYNYLPPGVQVSEDVSNSVAPLIATSDTICLVGPAPGYIQQTDSVYLNGTDTSVLGSLSGLDVKNVSITSIKAADPATTIKKNPSTTLSANISSTDTSITVADATSLSSQGTIVIENEQITYSAKAGNVLTVSARGANGTVAASHTNGVTVNTYDVNKGYDSSAYTFYSSDVTTTTTASVAKADATISVANAAGLPSAGVVTIDTEQIQYTGRAVTDESAIVTITAQSTGTFTLTYSGKTTSAIAYNATAATVQSALTALSNIGDNDVVVTGSAGGPYTLAFQGKLADINTADMTVDVSNLSISEVQTITFGGTVSGGTFTLTSSQGGSPQTTSAIAYNATAAQVQTALQALSNIGSGNVTVTGTTGTGGVLTVTYQGTLAKQDVAALTYTSSLTGTTPTITVATPTAGFTSTGTVVITQGGAGTLTGCVRGYNGTIVPDTHASGATVTASTKNKIARVTGGVTTDENLYKTLEVAGIPTGSYVTVTYTYEPSDYWVAQRFKNINAVENKFGAKFTNDGGAVNSPLSLAAQIAFENGATEIVVQPVFYSDTSTTPATKKAPTSAQIVDSGKTWQPTLEALRDVTGIGTIVPVIGQGPQSGSLLTDLGLLNIFQEVQTHIQYQKEFNDEYIMGIFGEDGTASTAYATSSTIRGHAEALQSRFSGNYNQQLVLISKSKFKRPKTAGTGDMDLGGQYAAAAIAGMIASRPVSSTLTRKNTVGFSAINHSRTKQENNEDSSRGLLVLEQKGYAIQVRHALTMDTTSVDRSEISVVKAKHKVINSLRLTIDSQIVGQIVADNNAPLIVASAISNTLSVMQQDNDIVSFANVQAQTQSLDPTIIEVTFSYRPAFPVNHISINFSIDLSSGTLTTNDTTNQINSGALNG